MSGDDWTAVRYTRGEGCSVTFWPLLVGLVLLALGGSLVGLLVGLAVRVWSWAL